MGELSIKDLEKLSGIKAHTIRMWEKRYEIFDPERTETNIRQYNSQHLKKLLNIASILNHGMKISKASSLSENELHEEIEQLQQKNIDAAKGIIVNKLVVSTLQCDAKTFESVYNLYASDNGVEQTIEDIIYPLLVRIGLMWTVSKMNPAQEHFASQIIRQKLFSAVESLPDVNKPVSYMLFLPENEHHEIGLLYTYYLLKKYKYHCIYLGPSVPLRDVQECAEGTNVTNIICTFTTARSTQKQAKYLENMASSFQKQKVHVHGVSQTNIQLAEQLGIKCLENIEQFKNLL